MLAGFIIHIYEDIAANKQVGESLLRAKTPIFQTIVKLLPRV